MGLEGNIAARLLAIGEDEGSNGAHLHWDSVTRTTLYIRRQNLCETYVSNVMEDQDNYVTHSAHQDQISVFTSRIP